MVGVGRDTLTGHNPCETVLEEMEIKIGDTIGINHKLFKSL